MSKLKGKDSCKEKQFLMSSNVASKYTCPECAKIENVTSSDERLQHIISLLRELLEEDKIMVFDPASRICLSGTDIEGICVNGDGIQISLSKTWQNIGD